MKNTVIDDIISMLETAHRFGAEIDEPEGARYIRLSETLVNQMISMLRQMEGDDAS